MKMFIGPILASLALALCTVTEAAVVLDTAAAPPQVEAGVPSSESDPISVSCRGGGCGPTAAT